MERLTRDVNREHDVTLTSLKEAARDLSDRLTTMESSVDEEKGFVLEWLTNLKQDIQESIETAIAHIDAQQQDAIADIQHEFSKFAPTLDILRLEAKAELRQHLTLGHCSVTRMPLMLLTWCRTYARGMRSHKLNRGLALQELERDEEAIASFDHWRRFRRL